MRRIVAALVGIVLAVVGAVLVINYARSADERAAADLETTPIVVAVEELAAGTPVEELGSRVETKAIPRAALVQGAVEDLSDAGDLVLAADVVPGEQLVRSQMVSENEFRARGQVALPAELESHHQVTVLLDKARALGGDIAPGDTVGVFMSFDVDTADVEEDDQQPPSEEGDGNPIAAGGSSVSLTDLTLHKVPVVRVEGAFVSAPGPEAEEGSAEDSIFITLALEPEDAARLIFAVEWGNIYLSREPDSAPEDEVPSIIITLPERGEDVLQ